MPPDSADSAKIRRACRDFSISDGVLPLFGRCGRAFLQIANHSEMEQKERNALMESLHPESPTANFFCA